MPIPAPVAHADRMPSGRDSSRDEIAAVRADVAALRIEFQTAIESLREDLESLNRQLGN
jgi:hypothetical protein